jgi:hypothetical protein
MGDTVKIMVSISTQKVGSECVDEIEFDRDAWESMTDDEKEEACREAAFNMIEWNWTEI